MLCKIDFAYAVKVGKVGEINKFDIDFKFIYCINLKYAHYIYKKRLVVLFDSLDSTHWPKKQLEGILP